MRAIGSLVWDVLTVTLKLALVFAASGLALVGAGSSAGAMVMVGGFVVWIWRHRQTHPNPYY